MAYNNQIQGNPFTKMNKVDFSQGLLDIAFKKAMKLKPPKTRSSKLDTWKELESNRINTASNIISSRLERTVKQFPSINLLHPFYLDLLDIIIKIDEVKKILGRIYGAKFSLTELSFGLISEIQSNESISNIKRIRKSAFGRISSIVYRLDRGLQKLDEARMQLSKLPGYDPSIPCVVVCGLPNVGKSSFIKAATSGKPEVASYPFTTKSLIFGHRKFGYLSIQFVDTPGLLDREFSKRNFIELQALTALNHLADIMLFLFDFTQIGEEKVQEQINLLSNIKKFYSSKSFFVILTKVDLLTDDEINEGIKIVLDSGLINEENILPITIKSDEGFDPLVRRIESMLKSNILVSTKFREIMQFSIDEDELDFVEEDLWFLE